MILERLSSTQNDFIFSKKFLANSLDSYLMSISRRGPVNPSTPTFGNNNLTETITNLIVAWKFNQKKLQESLFAL